MRSSASATDVRFSQIIAASAGHIDCEFVRADYGVRIIDALLAQPLHLRVVSLPFKRGLAGRLDVVLSLHIVHDLVQKRAPVLQANAAPIVAGRRRPYALCSGAGHITQFAVLSRDGRRRCQYLRTGLCWQDGDQHPQ